MSGRMSDEDRREVRAIHAKVDRENRRVWAWLGMAYGLVFGSIAVNAATDLIAVSLPVGVIGIAASFKAKAINDQIGRDLDRARALLIASKEMTR